MCARSSEASTVHSDCYEFVAQNCTLEGLLDHLWVITAWRTPWRHAPHFGLNEVVLSQNSPVFDVIGISRLRLLPPEILEVVYKHSERSLVWRFHAAYELARRLPVEVTNQLLSVPLWTIAAWKRGGQPVMMKAILQKPLMRLTIDSYGILKVERLQEHPPFNRWRAENRRFVILDQSSAEGITAHFKVKTPRHKDAQKRTLNSR